MHLAMRIALSCLILAIGCAAPAEHVDPKAPGRPSARAKNDTGAVHALPSTRLGDVPGGTFGPYFADTANGGLALWAALVDGKRAWTGRAFDARGEASGEALSFGPAPDEIGLAVLEARGSSPKSGYVLLYTRRAGDRTLLESRTFADVSKPAGEVQVVGEASSDVLWIDLVSVPGGTLALWAVRNAAGAEILSRSLGDAAEAHSVSTVARAWQAAPFGNGAAMGLVTSTGEASGGGRVELSVLDASGKPVKSVVVSNVPSAEAALDMVPAQRGLLFAWSDRLKVDAKVMLAAVDAGLNVVSRSGVGPARLGEQALVRLVPPHAAGGPAYLAFESLAERPASGRLIDICKIASDGKPSDDCLELVHSSDESVPELVATRTGLAALALAPACREGDGCQEAPLLPTYVEADRELSLKSSGPVQLSALGARAPDLAWGLSCPEASCRLLAAQSSVPAPVYLVKLAASPGKWRPAARRPARPSPPRGAALEVVASVEPVADVALARVGARTLGAWVTHFDPTTPWKRLTKPAADGRLDPPRATLQIRDLGQGAEPPSAAETISIRARSSGGVALAPAATAHEEVLLGWTALDFGQPQVFATLLDSRGKKLRQRMITRARGEKSDVAAVGAGDGWVLTWVDERHGDPELYAARINRLMQSAGPEKRITSKPGVAADVSLVAAQGKVWVAWSDARDAERPGWGDIYVAQLSSVDGSLVGSEQIVAKTPLHSRSPAVAPLGNGLAVAFIEEAPLAAGGSGEAELKLVRLDDAGRPSGASTSVRPTSGVPVAVTLDCANERCRVVALVKSGEQTSLEAFAWSASGASQPSRLFASTASMGSAVVPVLLGRELLFADRRANDGHVRRLWIDWE